MLNLKIAYFINNNGEKIQIHAYDSICERYLNRLICPHCSEKVDWINGKIQEKHFRHHHSTYSQECENYCESISVSNYVDQYQYAGLPLYLIKEFGKYSLSLGLFGLDETTIEDSESIELEIEINMGENSKIRKKVNFEYFAPHKMSFINIYAVKQQYNLEFSEKDIPIEIKNKWNANINGIGANGAIFTSGDYGGKKVSSSIGLKVNEEYLLFTNSNINNSINGILFEEQSEISFGWLKNYKIYKLTIKEINKDTIAFCNKFDMELHYSQPELIPVWPPCNILDEELIYDCDTNKYFILNTDNEKETDVYSHSLQRKMISEKISSSKYLITSNYKSNDFISLAHLHNQFTYSVIKRTMKEIETNPYIKVEVNLGKIIINTNVKVFVNHFYKNILLKSSVIKKKSSNEIELKKNERVDVLHGLDSIWSICDKSKIETHKDIDKLDKELLCKINRCKGEKIVIPDSFKWMVLKQKKYKRAYIELQKKIKKNEVCLELINLLRKY